LARQRVTTEMVNLDCETGIERLKRILLSWLGWLLGESFIFVWLKLRIQSWGEENAATAGKNTW
jgi:hypothetical protein